ncbi:type II toxin-antitoxin system TacA family antitoxin, partial [Escherichia coli]
MNMKPESKEAPINIRAKASQRDLIDMAANLVAKSRTDFMLDA